MALNGKTTTAIQFPDETDWLQKVALSGFGLGLLLIFLSGFQAAGERNLMFSGILVGLTSLLVYFLRTYFKNHPGIRNNGIWLRGSTSRGAIAWVTGIFLTGFYVVLYWWPDLMNGLIRSINPLSYWLRGNAADRWFLYGTFYTLAVLIMGVRALLKYRHSPYQIIRTLSVMFFQLVLAYLIPYFLVQLNQPEFYLSYFWPLKYDYLFPGTVGYLIKTPGALGVFFFFWTAIISLIGVPILTYFFGKRWYCSWVCGCGGLAETAGDPYRHLSDKSRAAWRWEVAIIYPILGFIVLTTLLLWINSLMGGGLLGRLSNEFSQTYGFFIGSIFSGVIGVGFYPIMGSRVWCRFGCPMAAYLGILQKHFSRFRITTNGGQCISCGNCSTYCEMGIDVRWYAQQGQPIIRASCVGCGMCATVCPRGVLNLENGPRENRYQPTALISPESLRILS
ncbi:4Fe-4S binding protein [Adhaeribacter radiodurans]|uniref:4Fe-4S binding protein n=1 Tax=Adhaeribacter radiodurans TaxID=2745197 RepID=A0A7L7L8F2_9BACT|nr:4Fe-4S dicluster domain-containing protein [Adhaeribacter radiodurans]QMU28815.1 4Fe-4S binding protein [Adhaeribacter radiodurans]